jgi:cell division transport system permease protein
MSLIRQWWRALANAVRALWQSPVATLFNLAALACAFGLSLCAVVWIGSASVGELASPTTGLSPQITVLLRSGAPAGDDSALARSLSAQSGVSSVRFVGRDRALRQLARDLGDDRLLAGLDVNPLPDALVLTVSPHLEAAALDALITRIKARGEVDEVLADRQFAERVRQIGHAARNLAQGLILLLLTSSAVVVFNTIRLQLADRQHEIELLRLLGASSAFVRRPFVLRGILLGALGAGLGWLLAQAMVVTVSGWLAPLANSWGLPTPPASVPLLDGLGNLMLGVLIGWVTAWLGATRHLLAVDRR